MLADAKANRVMIPPMRVADVPASDNARRYRSFKVQFQAPPAQGVFRWRIYIVSDTFVGEEVTEDIVVCTSYASVDSVLIDSLSP